MKFSPTLAGIAALLLAGSAPAFADQLYAQKITVTGTIQQPPLTDGGPGVVYPATIANMLTLLGLSDDPTTLRYYYDDTIFAIVIAPKGAKPTDNVTPVAVLYRTTGRRYGTDYVGGRVHPGLLIFGEIDKILYSDNQSATATSLTSYSYYKGAFTSSSETDTINIIAHGTIGTTNSIVSITIKDSY